ncbi:MAG: hypothetical protein H6Q18_588 [Bacteroidetes bacterium]|nr:hypothetical protein [Bacteroidota bacterium]
MEAKKLKDLIKFSVLILASIGILCCSLKSKPIFENCEINLLAQDDSIVPSQYSFYYFFCKGINNNAVKLQYKELKEVYQSQFNNLDYNDFLLKLLNQEITIDIGNRYYFQLDNSVCSKYESCDFDTFLSYYCKSNENGRYQLTKSLSQSELNTFSFLLFTNGYFVTFDDYLGVYRVSFKENIFCCE